MAARIRCDCFSNDTTEVQSLTKSLCGALDLSHHNMQMSKAVRFQPVAHGSYSAQCSQH